MSVNSYQNFVTSFDALVKQAYQAEGKLRGAVRVKTGVTGSTHRFPKLGAGVATQRVPQTDVTPMNVSHSYATATLTNWNAAEYVDQFDASKLNFDEKMELVKVCTAAIGRRMDQLILDAAAASANATQVGLNIGGTNTGLNIEKILRAKRLMDDANVPDDGNRHLVISARALEDALQETQIASSDYNVLMPLMTGQLKTWAGFQFHMIGTMAEGGVPKSSTTRNNFAFHKDAIGLAVGIDMKTEINYVPEKTSTLINALFSAGAVTVDTDGVFDVLTYEA